VNLVRPKLAGTIALMLVIDAGDNAKYYTLDPALQLDQSQFLDPLRERNL